MHDSGLDMDEFLCECVACRAVWMAMVESLRCMKDVLSSFVKLSFMVAKKLVSTFSDLWAR